MVAEGTVGAAVMVGVVEAIGATADAAMGGAEVFGHRLALESGSAHLIPPTLTSYPAYPAYYATAPAATYAQPAYVYHAAQPYAQPVVVRRTVAPAPVVRPAASTPVFVYSNPRPVAAPKPAYASAPPPAPAPAAPAPAVSKTAPRFVYANPMTAPAVPPAGYVVAR